MNAVCATQPLAPSPGLPRVLRTRGRVPFPCVAVRRAWRFTGRSPARFSSLTPPSLASLRSGREDSHSASSCISSKAATIRSRGSSAQRRSCSRRAPSQVVSGPVDVVEQCVSHRHPCPADPGSTPTSASVGPPHRSRPSLCLSSNHPPHPSMPRSRKWHHNSSAEVALLPQPPQGVRPSRQVQRFDIRTCRRPASGNCRPGTRIQSKWRATSPSSSTGFEALSQSGAAVRGATARDDCPLQVAAFQGSSAFRFVSPMLLHKIQRKCWMSSQSRGLPASSFMGMSVGTRRTGPESSHAEASRARARIPRRSRTVRSRTCRWGSRDGRHSRTGGPSSPCP